MNSIRIKIAGLLVVRGAVLLSDLYVAVQRALQFCFCGSVDHVEGPRALFFIELGSRRVHLAGCTAHRDEAWVTQQTRQVTWGLGEREEPARFLIRDRDRKFTRRFDAAFAAQAVWVVRTPVQAPEAKRIAERFMRAVRFECLDWLSIMNARHLERTVKVFVDHYNSCRLQGASAWSRRTVAHPSNPKPSVNRSVCGGVTGLAGSCRSASAA